MCGCSKTVGPKDETELTDTFFGRPLVTLKCGNYCDFNRGVSEVEHICGPCKDDINLALAGVVEMIERRHKEVNP